MSGYPRRLCLYLCLGVTMLAAYLLIFSAFSLAADPPVVPSPESQTAHTKMMTELKEISKVYRAVDITLLKQALAAEATRQAEATEEVLVADALPLDSDSGATPTTPTPTE